MFLGVLFALLAFVLMGVTVFSYFAENSIPSGWTTIVVLLLFFNAVQLLVIGILGVYMGAIYEEVKGRPRYIIDEEISHYDK